MNPISPEVLIIDDDSGIRELLARYLATRGFSTTGARDGVEGLDRCAERLPNLVLCDLRMPGLSGLEVLSALRDGHPDLPIIVVSGTGELDDAIKALKLGAWDFLTKPIEDFAVLDHALDRAFERARLLAENRDYRASLEAANANLANSLRRLEEDEEAGRKIQFALLPQDRLLADGLEFSRFLATSAILGGDFVDYFRIDRGHLGFYIADVSGHGVPSAVITVLLKSYVGRYLESYRSYGERTILDPAGLLSELNRGLLEAKLGKYLTIFYGVINTATGRLRFANGGQFPFPVLFDGKRTSEIGGRSRAVGLFPDSTYENQQIVLPARFSLHLFSDGVLELIDGQDLATRRGALVSLAAGFDADATMLAGQLGIASGRSLPDDATVLSLRRP